MLSTRSIFAAILSVRRCVPRCWQPALRTSSTAAAGGGGYCCVKIPSDDGVNEACVIGIALIFAPPLADKLCLAPTSSSLRPSALRAAEGIAPDAWHCTPTPLVRCLGVIKLLSMMAWDKEGALRGDFAAAASHTADTALGSTWDRWAFPLTSTSVCSSRPGPTGAGARTTPTSRGVRAAACPGPPDF